MDTQSELNYLANMKPPDTFGHSKYQSTYDLMNRQHVLDISHTQMMPTQPLVTHVEHIPPPPSQQQQLPSLNAVTLAANTCMPSSYASSAIPTLGVPPLIQQQTALEMPSITQQQLLPQQQQPQQQIQPPTPLLAPLAPTEPSSSSRLGVHLPPNNNTSNNNDIVNNNFCNNNALDAGHFTLNYNSINNSDSSNNMNSNVMMNVNANSISISNLNNNTETVKRRLSTDTTLNMEYPPQKKDKQELAQQQQQQLQLQQQQQPPLLQLPPQQQPLPPIDEKKKRKNIRDVMDTNQLDTITLKAQHEESERLARMAEQQKLLREYQQREAVLTHFDRFVNEHRVKNPEDLLELSGSPKNQIVAGEGDSEDDKKTLAITETECKESDESSDVKEKTPAEVVTIEDSSSDDDCIVLSDDEEDVDDDIDDPENSGLHVKDEFNIPDHLGRVVINVGHPDNEEDIYIAPQIARTIKPHQIGGIRFLFDNIIESTTRFKTSGGFGCILAHSMGLGKTLQVVCFCDIFLRYTTSKTVVCVMPINTLQNWQAEFDMWIPKVSDNCEYVRPRQFDVFVLNDQHKTFSARARVILQWKEMGGVLLIGYELFRLMALKLSTTGRKRSKRSQLRNDEMDESHHRLMDEIYEALVRPGPDLVICDEGHRIKNSQAGISQALKQIRTRRRIVLTGYPLQNNLVEYWCMVDFVRPNYLGTKTEFCNMFERPIQNGLCVDSTPDDIKLMRYRAHVLHSLLLGFVQRRSHTVLQLSLPEKQEFVILTRMTDLQRQLYDTFMNDFVRTKNVPNPLKAFAVCCKIWNHPDVLYDAMKVAEYGLDLDIEEVEEINSNASGSASMNGGSKMQSLLAPLPPLPSSEFLPPQSNAPSSGHESSHILNNNSMISSCPQMINGQPTSQLHTNSLGLNTQQNNSTSQQLNCQQMGRQDFLHNNNFISNNCNSNNNYNTNFPNLGNLQNCSTTNSPMNSMHIGNVAVNSSDTINYHNSTTTPLYGELNHYGDIGSGSGNGSINGNSSNGSSSVSGISTLNSTMNSNSYQTSDLQSSYFSYSSMLSSMGSPLKPNYVGCMVKQATNTNVKVNGNGNNVNITSLDETHTQNSSSEIVDLDTKEIKTIETDIDMDKNIQLNKQKEEEQDRNGNSGITNNNNKSMTVSAAGISANGQNSSGLLTDNEIKNDGMEISSFSGLQAALENNGNLNNINNNQEQEQRRGCDKITYDWASKFMKKYEPGLISNSPKMTIFFCILNESVRIGDRVLLFSQSLLTLNVIEKFLMANLVPGENMNWTYGRHYFRLDGSTTSQERERLVNEFNTNPNVKLFLISTKAGSLGINLIGANRVIIFDASWNPCHDTQAIYRIYRYGQKRACFVYRIVMDKCLEKKIYDRQIKKQGMSDRVVDECNPDNHLSIKDVTNLCYDYDDEDAEKNTTTLEFKKPLDSYTDTIMRKILEEYKCHLTKEPFFHESLLVDRKNDKLSQAEKRMAHRSYEMQKKTSSKTAFITTGSGNRVQFQTIRKDGALITKPIASVRPMQAPRSQTQKYSSGLRTTRWIPAEVWQKQGMTAQEMSLPLDVVIPTNSSNKSKIIIKAGQRVMVLKSAKGIYMQLDSGKIIAIRTMNKPNAINKSNDKTDVIDITGESETNANDAKTDKVETETTNSSFTDSSMDVDSSTSTTSSGLQKNLKSEIDKTTEIETTHKTQQQPAQQHLQQSQQKQHQVIENINQTQSQFNQLALFNNNKTNTTTTIQTTAATTTLTTPVTANINVASNNNNSNQHHNHHINNSNHHHHVANTVNNVYHHNNHNINTNNNQNTVNTVNPLKNDDKSVHRVQQQHSTTIHDNRQQMHVARNQQQQSLLLHHQQHQQQQHKQQHHQQQSKQLQQQHRAHLAQNPNENLQHSANSNNNTNLTQQQQHHQQLQQPSHNTTIASATPTHNLHHQQQQQQQSTTNNYATVNHHATNAANAAAAAVAAAHQHHSHHHHHHPQSYYSSSHAYASAAAAAAAAAVNQTHHSQTSSLRNPHHHHYGTHAGRTASDISPYTSYAAPSQYTDFPTYAASHDTIAQQNARYHSTSGNHSNLTQTHATSLSDFYAYYPQWSPFMLPPPPPTAPATAASTAAAAAAAVAAVAAASPTDTTNHLMHHSYPSAHGHSVHSHAAHSHSSLPKVQSANNSGGGGGPSSQWQQYQ